MKIKNAIFAFILSLFISSQAWAMQTKGVVVTIQPLHSLVSGVIGNTGKAELLLSGNTSPHDFQLKPSQMKHLQEANVVFYINDSFETFLSGAFAALPAHIRKAAMAKKAGLTILSHRKGGAWDVHKHDAHEGHDEHDTNDEHAKGEHNDNHDEHSAHEDHDLSHDDMHVWLDPENSRRMVKYITRELSAIYPENRDIYKANAIATIEKIDVLDKELKASLEGLQDKPFIVFHDAYQYFERSYGLSGVGSIAFEPDEAPSPNRIKEVRKKLQQTGAKCVFREPQFSDRLIKTVTEGTNAISGTLDPLGANLYGGEKLYFSLMRNLASSLKQCLK